MVTLDIVMSEKVTTFFLNSDYDFRNHLPNNQDIDCVHTDYQNILLLAESITVCYRSLPFMYTSNSGFYLATSLSFGTIDNQYRRVQNGFVFGVWDSAYWIGTRHHTNESMIWVTMGDNLIKDLHVWRHICLAINFRFGTAVLVEKGVIIKRTKSPDLIYEKQSMNHVAVGCYYKGSSEATGYQTMYGRVTDLQLFGTFLSNQEMQKITECKERMKGDVLSWDHTAWILSGTSIKKESLEFTQDICRNTTVSFHLIPLQANFNPKSLELCQLFSADIAIHHSVKEFDQILRYLLSTNAVNSKACHRKSEESSVILQTWLAAHDNDVEGLWKDWYTGEVIPYLPWAENRPYPDGTQSNCLSLQASFSSSRHGELRDIECSVSEGYCPLCQVDAPMLKIFVRGLCKDSLFNRVYTYNLDRDGQILYLGEKSSMITYSNLEKTWFWYDKKDNKSIARSSAPFSSLLMGTHLFDFSDVVNDNCLDDGEKRLLKFTTCHLEQFTCRSGACINIENKCDKVQQCADGSDEDDCSIVNLSESYQKSIAPFSFDTFTNR